MMADRTIVFSFDRKLGARLFEVYEHREESPSMAPRRRDNAAPKGPSPRGQRRKLAELCEGDVVDFRAYRELLAGGPPA